ncbi:MAG TPA: heme biosynthesis protein HemY [Nitrosomonas mobilis]|nr:heme biosynthesis protein HemY [Nitrosomonas mobilis]
MRLMLWALVLFAISAAVVLAAYYNNGTVLFTVPPYTVELAFNIFIIGSLLAFIVFYYMVRVMIGLLNVRASKAQQFMLSGLNAFLETRFDQAQKAAEKAFRLADAPDIKAINAVIAARSAHRQGKVAQRDQLLAAIAGQRADTDALRLITEAELKLEDGRYTEALTALQALYSTGGWQSTAVLQLELKIQEMLQNWDAVLDLVDILSKRRSANQSLISSLRHTAHLQNIKKYSTDFELLKKYWQEFSSEDKQDSQFAAAAASSFMVLGDHAWAQKIIEHNLDKQPDTTLFRLYADCRSGSVSWQIQHAEKWLIKYPNNAELLLTLGKLCAYGELWGKAQNYLEASLSIEPSYPAHLALAQLNEQLGEQASANEHYRQGLQFALKQIDG